MREVKTRRQAAEAGENKYFTGRPCKNGHLSLRYTNSGICCACNVAAAKKYNNGLRVAKNTSQAGLFAYSLHVDDFPAALAYCQALDLMRGRTPSVPAQRRPPIAAVDLNAPEVKKKAIDEHNAYVTALWAKKS